MSIDVRVKSPREQTVTMLKKLLGSLELKVMEFMWHEGRLLLNKRRRLLTASDPIAKLRFEQLTI